MARIRAAMDGVVDSGQFIGGAAVSRCESDLADFAAAGFAVGVGSGTDALLLALLAHGIGPGDVVITTPFSFASTAEAIVRVGATPHFVDVDPDTLCISGAALERALARTNAKALVIVHLFGRIAHDAIAVARRHGVTIIHDAAQAFGPRLTQSGTSCCSFQSSKSLAAFGDAGAVLTDDGAIADRVRTLARHGVSRGRCEGLGMNSRLDALQAAVISVKLGVHHDAMAKRRHHAARYHQALADVPLGRLAAFGAGDVPLFYVVRSTRRDRLQAALAEHGIESRVYYPELLCDQPAFQCDADVPIARRATRDVLSLPVHEQLHAADVDRVVEVLRAASDAASG